MSTNPAFPEIWYITLSVTGGPNLLTRPRYAQIVARFLNAGHQQETAITRSHMVLPDQLLLLIEPVKTSIDEWLQDFAKTTALELCESLRTDIQDDRREWYNVVLNRDNNAPDIFWSRVTSLRVGSMQAYDEQEAQMLAAPIKAGYVYDPQYYAYTWFNNRSGILYTQLDTAID